MKLHMMQGNIESTNYGNISTFTNSEYMTGINEQMDKKEDVMPNFPFLSRILR